MVHSSKIRPLHLLLILVLVVLLPLGGITLAATFGASPLPWLIPNVNRTLAESNAARDAALRRTTDSARSMTLSAGGVNHMLHVTFVDTVPTPTPAAVYLPVVTR